MDMQLLLVHVNGEASGVPKLRSMRGWFVLKGKAMEALLASQENKDGCLDADEFAVAMHLARDSTNGKQLPANLPWELIPPSKRRQ